jgi:hypothetical protein
MNAQAFRLFPAEAGFQERAACFTRWNAGGVRECPEIKWKDRGIQFAHYVSEKIAFIDVECMQKRKSCGYAPKGQPRAIVEL